MNPYEDIMNLPHHVSATRPRMPMRDRAAQFSPFAALTGYGDAIGETTRITDEKIELDESRQAILEMKQHLLINMEKEQPEITITYFRKDEKKAGGRYLTVTGRLKRIDEYEHTLNLTDGVRIPMEDIFDIAGEVFREFMDFYDVI